LKDVPIQPREGFLDFFSAVRDLGLKYTIGSQLEEKYAILLLEKSGLVKLFGYENIVLREDFKNPKPAPDVWIKTAKRASVAPDEQMVFEDSPYGIEGAVKVGAYCIGMPIYNREEVVNELIQAGAKRIFTHWKNIPTNLIDSINAERQEHLKYK
jgi:beta-phosphoglucomutase-like phosphatase (HAD superfamily)